MINSFNQTLSGKHLICPSILNDSFAGYSNLGCRSLLFMIWNTCFQPLPAYKISFEKSTDSLMGLPLQITVSFSLASFKILSLSLTLGNLIMLYLGVLPVGSNFFGILCVSQTCMSISFTRLGNFSHYFFRELFNFLLFIFSFWHICDLGSGMFKVVPEAPKSLLVFLNSCFFILFWLNVYFFLLVYLHLHLGWKPFFFFFYLAKVF